MTWDDLISHATTRLRSHLSSRHFTPWSNRPVIDGRLGTNVMRMQHYWGARGCIENIRDYRRRRDEADR